MTQIPSFPNDATGDALRRCQRDGVDFSRPHRVDFHIACQRLKDAEEIAKSCEALGFFTKTTKDDTESDGSPFTVWCTKTIMLNHAEITQIEMLLDRLARSLGGFVDGWGTWGGDEAGGGNNRDHQNWAGSPFSDRRTD